MVTHRRMIEVWSSKPFSALAPLVGGAAVVVMAIGLATGLATGQANAASSAQLIQTSGEVMVSNGGGFRAVTSLQEVPPNAQLLVRNGGAAILRFADGCVYTVHPGEVFTVSGASPCAEPIVQSKVLQSPPTEVPP